MLTGIEGGGVGEGQQVMWRKGKPGILGLVRLPFAHFIWRQKMIDPNSFFLHIYMCCMQFIPGYS